MVVRGADPTALVRRRLGSVSGVASVVVAGAGPRALPVSIAPCSTITQITRASSCGPKSSYLISDIAGGEHPGQLIKVPAGSLRIPANARLVPFRSAFLMDGGSLNISKLVLTPGAAARDHLTAQTFAALVHFHTLTPAAEDHLSDAVASIDPLAQVTPIGAAVSPRDLTIDKLRRVLTAGAVAVLLVIGASLLVSVAEQLRERRRVLAVMAAFGTRGSTLGWSVLWQTALPVVLGLTLAIVLGAALGAVLMAIARSSDRLRLGLGGPTRRCRTGRGGRRHRPDAADPSTADQPRGSSRRVRGAPRAKPRDGRSPQSS